MHMVRHDDDCMQTYPRCTCGAGALARRGQNPSLAQTVCKNQIAGPLRQNHSSAGTEGDKEKQRPLSANAEAVCGTGTSRVSGW